MAYQHPLAYLLGIEGVALLRAFAGESGRESVEARISEIRRLLDTGAGDAVVAQRVDTAEGYRLWSETYDSPATVCSTTSKPQCGRS